MNENREDRREDSRDEREILRDEAYTNREDGRVEREIDRDKEAVDVASARDTLAVAAAIARDDLAVAAASDRNEKAEAAASDREDARDSRQIKKDNLRADANTDAERLRDAVSHERFVELENRFRRFFTKALIAFAVVGISSAFAIGGFGFVLKRQARDAREIQLQRYQSLVVNCEAQNARNMGTIAKAKSLKPATQKTVMLLVDELQPFVKDCDAFAGRRVKGER